MRTICEKIRLIAENTAEAHGCTAELTFNENCPPLVNTEEQAGAVLRVASDVVGTEHVNHNPHLLVYGSEDFAMYLTKAPGCFFFVNNV